MMALAIEEAIKKATRDRINRQARIIADEMVGEEDSISLIRMNSALSILSMALGMETDQQANLLLGKARKLKKSKKKKD